MLERVERIGKNWIRVRYGEKREYKGKEIYDEVILNVNKIVAIEESNKDKMITIYTDDKDRTYNLFFESKDAAKNYWGKIINFLGEL